jgi:hypothetical protein
LAKSLQKIPEKDKIAGATSFNFAEQDGIQKKSSPRVTLSILRIPITKYN